MDIWLHKFKRPKPSGQTQCDWQLMEMAGMETAGMWIRVEVSEQIYGSPEKECRERERQYFGIQGDFWIQHITLNKR